MPFFWVYLRTLDGIGSLQGVHILNHNITLFWNRCYTCFLELLNDLQLFPLIDIMNEYWHI